MRMHSSTQLQSRQAPLAGRPNFLVILTDQHRGDGLGCAWPNWRADDRPPPEGMLRTPHLDRLAAQGVRLSRAYVNNPLCMPSRATLLTGLTPRGHGVRTNGINLSRSLPTITDALTVAGYRTHSVGKIHTRVFGTPHGIDPETLDPTEFPESLWMWERGKITHLPEPYYGFQTTEWIGGHGPGVRGDYVDWLHHTHPAEAPLLSHDAAIPAASGAPEAFRLALPAELHYNTWTADRAINFLEAAAGRRNRQGDALGAGQAQPFMLCVSFSDPHHPFCAPEPWYSMYDRRAVPMPVRREGELETLPPHVRATYERTVYHSGRRAPTKLPDAQMREIIAITYGMISFVDQQVGRIQDTLDQLGLAENTVVVFTSNHGELLGDHWLLQKGPFHFAGLLNVPSLWRWPDRFPAGHVSDALVSHLDFAPTILDLAGVAIPETGSDLFRPPPPPLVQQAMRPWPGRSLQPLLAGQATRVQDAVVVENDEDWLGFRLRTVITQTHQLTVYTGDDGDLPFGELFDLAVDPAQLHNRWHLSEAREIKQALGERLRAELIRTDSRLPRRLCHA